MIGKVHFGTTIHAVMRENRLSMAEVGKASGTIESQFSKWKAGRWQVIPEERLVAVLNAACKTAEQRSACLMAYCYDMLPDKERPLVMFGAKRPPDEKTATGAFNAEMQLRLRRFTQSAQKNQDFRQMMTTMDGWAKRITEAG
jgi:hypothetical protein